MQDQWTIANCVKELTDHGWIYEGTTTLGGSHRPMHRWVDPTKGLPVQEHLFSLRAMRDLCRQKFQTHP